MNAGPAVNVAEFEKRYSAAKTPAARDVVLNEFTAAAQASQPVAAGNPSPSTPPPTASPLEEEFDSRYKNARTPKERDAVLKEFHTAATGKASA